MPSKSPNEFELSVGVFAPPRLNIIGGKGTQVWTETGQKFLDCIGGHGTSNLGHGNAAIATAVSKAWQNYAFTTARFGSLIRAEFLTKLATKVQKTLSSPKFFLSNSGAESVEAALKFARVLTGRTKILAAKRAFHGRTFGALSATWRPEIKTPFEPLVPDFDFFAFNKEESLAEKIDQKTAAVILEPVQGEAGVYLAKKKFFQKVQKLCRENGALLICDEVQTGIGRTGKFLASEHFGARPDLICLAKALGNGYPIGATAIRGKLLSGKNLRNLHSSTFGGNLPACQAGLAVLNFLERKKLVERAARLGALLKTELQKVSAPLIKEVRGLGLMLAVEFRQPIAGKIAEQFQQQGILVLLSGTRTLRFLPPLTITEREVQQIAKVFQRIF